MIDLTQLKSRVNLHATIAERVQLTKKGRTWWGKCPFHDEKSASFAVHAEYFYCHGCHAKGDVIDFTALIENTSKGRAIRILAERAGMDAGKAPDARESAYKRDLEAQAAFWWRKLRELAVARLELFCGQLTDAPYDASFFMAHIAGARVRVIDSIGPELRGKLFLRMRTAADRREFERANSELEWESEQIWRPLIMAYIDRSVDGSGWTPENWRKKHD